MSSSEPNPPMPIGAVTVSMYPGGRIQISTQGMVGADLLQALLLHALLVVSQQVMQQASSALVLAAGGIPRAD